MIFHFPTPITIAIDIAAWFIIHMGVSFIMARRKLSSFEPKSWLYTSRRWERDGRIYSSLFRLKSWKHRLPDGAAIFKDGFTKKHLTATTPDHLEEFARETCRAELTHWIVFLFGPVFLVWNLWWVGMIMVLYASAVNLPCIVTQRYNRIRLQRATRR